MSGCEWRHPVKIIVIGGTGLIGSKVVGNLKRAGHEAIAAAPNTGVNTLTGEGLAEALKGAEVVVDVSNSPSFEDRAALAFFETAGKNIAVADAAAGVKHHVALSVVGTERLSDSGYMRAKLAQEKIIQTSPIPYTLIRATQFFEFIRAIGQSGMVDGVVHLPQARFQPMAAQDVAAAVADLAGGAPLNGMVEIAGPRAYRIDELVAKVLDFDDEAKLIQADAEVPYFGAKLADDTLLPGPGARLGATSFDWWLVNVPPPPKR
jgi:uncharacterized protein YbjT (DUF2867 family)